MSLLANDPDHIKSGMKIKLQISHVPVCVCMSPILSENVLRSCGSFDEILRIGEASPFDE